MKHLFTSFALFFSIVGLGYMVLSLQLWTSSLQSERDYYIHPTEKYIQKHHADITSEIFQKLFSDAKKCVGVSPDSLKTQCENEITYRLAISIKEEDFLSKDEYGEYGWPTDLFFVKQTNESFARLGWEGKYVDITSTTDKNWISRPLWLRQLAGQCHVFKIETNSLSNCEVYQKLALPNNETGYLVRLIGLDEDTLFPLIFIIPLFLASGTIGAIVTGHFSETQYFIIPLVKFIVIFILAIVIAYKYYRHSVKR